MVDYILGLERLFKTRDYKFLGKLLKHTKEPIFKSEVKQQISTLPKTIEEVSYSASEALKTASYCSNSTKDVCRRYLRAVGKERIVETLPNKKTEINIKGLSLAPNSRAAAEYLLPNGKTVRIYEVKHSDLPFLERLSSNMEHYMDSCGIEGRDINDKRMIMETTINVMKEKLKLIPDETKTHLFLAESDGKICGALAGGLPKKAPNGSMLYSSRKSATEFETELNWLATWPQGNGVGKSLLSEYLDTMGKDGFNKIFIQSEIPKLSDASKFYKRMGFDKVYKIFSERRVSKVEYNKDVLPCLEPDAPNMYDYKIIPMLGEISTIEKIKNAIFKTGKREGFLTSSVNLDRFINN